MRHRRARPEGARALVDARPDAELIVIADKKHVLKRLVGDDRDKNLAAYTIHRLPFVPSIVDAMAEFVVRTFRSR